MDVMSKMRFGHRWINWMKWCCSTVTFSILINGSLLGFFRSSKGLRQGDPFPPIFSYLPWKLLASCYLVQEMGALFLVSEWEEEEERGCLCHLSKKKKEGLFVSHLLFADDTLIFVTLMQISCNILAGLSCGLMRF